MMGRCDYCGEVKRINKKTKFCAECVRQFNETVEKYFDGDPFLPLKVAAEELSKLRASAPPASQEKPE